MNSKGQLNGKISQIDDVTLEALKKIPQGTLTILADMIDLGEIKMPNDAYDGAWAEIDFPEIKFDVNIFNHGGGWVAHFFEYFPENGGRTKDTEFKVNLGQNVIGGVDLFTGEFQV